MPSVATRRDSKKKSIRLGKHNRREYRIRLKRRPVVEKPIERKRHIIDYLYEMPQREVAVIHAINVASSWLDKYELCENTGYSIATINTATKMLLRKGLIRKRYISGKKADWARMAVFSMSNANSSHACSVFSAQRPDVIEACERKRLAGRKVGSDVSPQMVSHSRGHRSAVSDGGNGNEADNSDEHHGQSSSYRRATMEKKRETKARMANDDYDKKNNHRRVSHGMDGDDVPVPWMTSGMADLPGMSSGDDGDECDGDCENCEDYDSCEAPYYDDEDGEDEFVERADCDDCITVRVDTSFGILSSKNAVARRMLFDNRSVTVKNLDFSISSSSEAATPCCENSHEKAATPNSQNNPKKVSGTTPSLPGFGEVEEPKTEVTKAPKKQPAAKKVKINYNFQTHMWENITGEMLEVWASAFPAVNIEQTLNEVRSWLECNPDKRKTNYERFLNNWFSKAQNRGGNRQYYSNNNYGGGSSSSFYDQTVNGVPIRELPKQIRENYAARQARGGYEDKPGEEWEEVIFDPEDCVFGTDANMKIRGVNYFEDEDKSKGKKQENK